MLTAQPFRQDRYRELGPEAMHALRLQEAAEVVLQEAHLTAANRAILVNAIRIARTLHGTGQLAS